MGLWELIGYVAAALVLAAFYMRDMVALRLAAMCSNLAFIAYGLGFGLAPVWLLHALLLPMNGCRLLQEFRARGQPEDKLTRNPTARSCGRSAGPPET